VNARREFDGVRGVLFDAGGTLIHLDGERICRAAGVDVDSAAFSRAERDSMAAMRSWILANPTSTDRERVPVFFDGILTRLGIAEEDRRREAARAVETLRSRGYRTGVVSNADGRVRRLLEEAGLAPHLEVVIDSAEVGVEKPDPRIFLAATGRIETEPSACAYVGDIYEFDVVGARAAGLRPILIGPGEAPASDPVMRVERLPELLELFP
jgi:HAD superfamily hydrolase (TIGR01509 family)